jgi:hypothetical protein
MKTLSGEGPVDSGAAVTADRQCGRCRRSFEGDPTLFFQSDWALCPECAEILLPTRPPTV